MFDKEAQRARAQQLSAALAAQGHVAPVLPMPPIKPKGSGIYDLRGNEFKVDDSVARACKGMLIDIQKVTKIENGKLYLNKSIQAMLHPERLLIVK